MKMIAKVLIFLGLLSVCIEARIKCVKVCDEEKCGENEVWNNCGSTCGDLTCKMQSLAAVVCVAGCKPGCFCAEGFVRENGVCIPVEKCPQCTGKHEVYKNTCGSACPGNCDEPAGSNPCIEICAPGCFCADGSVRDSKGKCILIKDCNQCPLHEQYSACGAACQRNCNSTDPLPCLRLDICEPGCICDEGFVRAEAGKDCIPIEKCPGHCGKHELYDPCGSACPTSCANPLQNKLCIALCVSGCFCEAGYLKNSDSKCVLPRECKKCPKNEAFAGCGAVCEGTCVNQNRTICPDLCELGGGCTCDTGFVRQDGKCISPEECPVIKPCGKHAHYTTCGTACPLTCTKPFPPNECVKPCIIGCICDDGYVKDVYGNCVLIKDCTDAECGENEEFSECGSPCQSTCAHPEEIICQAIRCQSGCFCKEGYVRDEDGKCIKPDKCRCARNEFLNTCGSACGDLTCNNYEKPPPCTKQCVKGCYCVDDYVRNGTKQCVSREDCPEKP